MQRRDFIKSVAATGIIGTMGRRANTEESGWRRFEITYRINIKDADADTDVRLWVPVPQDTLDYQRVLDLSWRSPVATHFLWEATSRAPIVSAIWMDPKIAREIVITARVATRDRSGFYPDASHDELAEYLEPTASSPNDGIVLAKARDIVGARTAPVDKARAIFDWIVDKTFRRAETRGCGLGNIVFMLESGDLGGKCADINSLFVGLARAAGLPARDFFGIRVADSKLTKSLGKSGDITKAQHCRAEVYIDNQGWFPVAAGTTRWADRLPDVSLCRDRARL